jgi:phosphatidylcholine synthase
MWAAALVHLFTALGAVAALLALEAIFDARWETAFAWLGVALFIDAVDGTLARRVKVSQRLPRFSGERLDLVVDYVTYVLVPALALRHAGFLPGAWGLGLAGLILLSSLFHFADTASKADDHRFVGFPAVWNLVAFYVFAFGLSQAATAVLVSACIALTFVPLRWVHPMRTVRLRTLTLSVATLWAAAALATLWCGFPATGWARAVLIVVAAYAFGITLWDGRMR